VLAKGSLNPKFDRETQGHYIIWDPIVIGMGKTKREALEDLRAAAHFGVDTLIDLRLKQIYPKKED
jgi:hypothetical protein